MISEGTHFANNEGIHADDKGTTNITLFIVTNNEILQNTYGYRNCIKNVNLTNNKICNQN